MSLIRNISEKLKNINCKQKERGAIFVLTALLLPIMFGCLGIAYDVGTIYMHKSRLQNVADAAALAGGRAYIESQAKTNENDRDAVDGTMDYRSKAIADCTYKNGRSMTVKYEFGDEETKDRGSTTKHPDADAAADTYIYKNIVNLGNTVYADKYSHFAVNYGSATSKIFYRVGLYETVPLRFLPVITDKYSETVRTGAIALVELGTTDNSGGGSATTNARTILDNLYTFSNYISLPSKTDNYDFNGAAQQTNKVNSTYEGAIVYTDSNAQFYEVHETEIFKKVFYGSGAFGVNERLAELFDEFGYYAELNSSFDVTQDVYINAFSNVFEAPNTVITLENSEMNSTSIRAKNGTYFVKREINNGDLTINEAIGNESDPPLFLKYPTDHQVMHIDVNADNVRPIIIVYLGSNEIVLQKNGTFRGIIYAPYATVSCPSENFTFYGSIMAKNLLLRGKNQKFYQFNYLKDAEGFMNVLPSVSSSLRTITQTEYDQIFNDSLSYYSTEGNHSNNYGVSSNLFDWIAANATNLEAFASLPDGGGDDSSLTKQNIIKAWMVTYERVVNELQNKYDDFQLASMNKVNKFMWDGYDPSSGDGGNDENESQTASSLRLINFRTEYRENADPNASVDPFIYMTLGNPLAY